MSHQHLTIEERSQIKLMLSMGAKQKDIAKAIKRPPWTVSREIVRNSGKRGYRYKQAQQMADERRQVASARAKKWTPELEAYVESRLEEKHSPEQISGHLKANQIHISHERIYQFVHANRKDGGFLYTNLRHGGKKYNYNRGKKEAGRGHIPNRVDIAQRPKLANNKSRLGDWEGDLIIGKNHQGALLSMVDRKSKFTLLSLLPSKKASEVLRATSYLFKRIPRKICHTITYDNGKEFSAHETIALSLNAQCYFATPYRAWERGLNEHTNGLVRQYLPKKTDFTRLNIKDIQKIEDALNDRPRKVLGFRTPREVFMGIERPSKIAIGA